MIQFKRLHDRDDIKEAFKKDNLYKSVLQIENLESWDPEHSYNWYLGYEDGNKVGVLLVIHESKTAISFHAGLYKEFLGSGSRYLDEILDQFHTNLPEYQVWTKTLDTNQAAIKCLKRTGFKQTGYIPNAYNEQSILIFSEKR